ncbi:MAG TPA: alpha/beta fold hydrolase [Hyphomonadaceae bacterium]|jgi:pimeloyl-ACP methyl ester carboxylesterase|nr:alpha/beta fold hydrolase [Hyphomonadaceae bacterium]
MPGLPIVFVPGLMVTARIYEHQALELGQRHPVLFANHWSHGSMAEIARAILGAAPPRFALAGMSMGGYVALEIMRRAPERVDRLVLMSTSAKPDTPERSEDRRSQVAAAKSAGNMRAWAKALYPKLVHPARHEDLPLLTAFIDMAEQLGVEAFARQIEAIIGRADSRPLLSEIRIPTLVIAGKDDRLITPDNSEEIAKGIPGAKLELVEHCGHMGMIERPETYTKLLTGFLD